MDIVLVGNDGMSLPKSTRKIYHFSYNYITHGTLHGYDMLDGYLVGSMYNVPTHRNNGSKDQKTSQQNFELVAYHLHFHECPSHTHTNTHAQH